jgi:heme-degrading monooxygenase HmoA
MYLRMTRVHTPPEKIEEGIKNFQSNILPRLRSAPGNQGGVLVVNRQTGEGIGVSYWESAKALGASEQVGIDSRVQTTRDVSGTKIVNVERAEVMVMDRAAPPKAGSFNRSTTGAGDPEKLDAGISALRNKALPILKAQKGYRATIAAVDRQSGRVFISTVWDSKADLDASESKIAGVRAEVAKAAGITAETLKVEVFEAAAVELAAAAAAVTAKA